MSGPFAHVAPILEALRLSATPRRLLRLTVPAPLVAFSRRDQRRDGFDRGVAAAEAAGFAAAVRPVGGTFAPMHEGSLVVDEFGWSPAGEWPDERFDRHAGILEAVLRALGVDARIGEVPGEYCPGGHSVNRGGAQKISGTAQRVTRGAWLVSSVIQIDGAERLRAVTADVAAALGTPLDITRIGAVSETVPATVDDVAAQVRAAFLAQGVEAME